MIKLVLVILLIIVINFDRENAQVNFYYFIGLL